ncbi:MAG: alcohol dehydrogenase catalytic domain-containing protein [Bacillota bacterium]
MKAAVLKSPYELHVQDIPKPEPGFGEVLVRIRATAICGTDLGIYQGKHKVNYPLVLGHETTGEVEKLGEGVTGFKVGDRVANNPLTYCGMCYKCYRGDVQLCEKGGLIGRESDGSFAEYIALPKERLFKLPDSISFVDGTNINLLATCLWGLAKISITPIDSVVVLGQGVSGLIWNQLARVSGAHPVMGISRSQWKLDLCEKTGATAINAKEADPVETVKQATGGKGASVVIEAAGTAETITQAIEMAATGGTILQFGIGPVEVTRYNFSQLYFKEVKIVGTRAMRPLDFLDGIKLIDRGTIDISFLVTHKFPLAEINDGFALVSKGGKTLRTVIEI